MPARTRSQAVSMPSLSLSLSPSPVQVQVAPKKTRRGMPQALKGATYRMSRPESQRLVGTSLQKRIFDRLPSRKRENAIGLLGEKTAKADRRDNRSARANFRTEGQIGGYMVKKGMRGPAGKQTQVFGSNQEGLKMTGYLKTTKNPLYTKYYRGGHLQKPTDSDEDPHMKAMYRVIKRLQAQRRKAYATRLIKKMQETGNLDKKQVADIRALLAKKNALQVPHPLNATRMLIRTPQYGVMDIKSMQRQKKSATTKYIKGNPRDKQARKARKEARKALGLKKKLGLQKLFQLKQIQEAYPMYYQHMLRRQAAPAKAKKAKKAKKSAAPSMAPPPRRETRSVRAALNDAIRQSLRDAPRNVRVTRSRAASRA